MPENFENRAENKPEELTNQEKLLNSIMGREYDDPSISVANEEQMQNEKKQFEDAFRRLDKRAQKIITLRYGLDKDGATHTLEEIGQIVGVSKSRVAQLEHRALWRLGVERNRNEWLKK